MKFSEFERIMLQRRIRRPPDWIKPGTVLKRSRLPFLEVYAAVPSLQRKKDQKCYDEMGRPNHLRSDRMHIVLIGQIENNDICSFILFNNPRT